MPVPVSELASQYGIFGLVIGGLVVAIGILWREYVKMRQELIAENRACFERWGGKYEQLLTTVLQRELALQEALERVVESIKLDELLRKHFGPGQRN
jgi:hypothetical protein